MITPNPVAHMSAKDRVRFLASQAQTLPGWGLSDKAFHASIAANRDVFAHISQVHQAIKAFYLNHGHSLEQWQVVIADPRRFNRVWRQSLGLMLDDSPPPVAFRRVLPLQSSN